MPVAQRLRDVLAAKDVDRRLPAAWTPGAHILESFLVATGPILGGDAARSGGLRRVAQNCRHVGGLVPRPLWVSRRVDLAEEPRQLPPRRLRQRPGEQSLHRQSRHLVDVLGGNERS